MSVNLDCQLVSVAKEIENEAVNGMLAAEFHAVESFASQSPPEFALLGRHLAAQFSGPCKDGRVNATGWL